MLAEAVFDFYALTYAESAQKYELSLLKACREVHISWHGLQSLCINVCRKLLNSMNYPFSEHAGRFILAGTVFIFYALAYAGDCSKVQVSLLRAYREVDIS